MNSNNYLAADPFYLSTDGLLFIIKDSWEIVWELTDEEAK